MNTTQKNKQLKKVLTIAGSDSSGGAGIQADLKTFTALGVYGMSCITAITAQNTTGVQGIRELCPEFVGMQIDSVMHDIGVDSVKIGMLANSEIVRIVAGRMKKYQIKFIILDPVMVAKSGDTLLQPEAQKAMIEKLFPLTYLLTPNLYEAQLLTKTKITSVEQMKQAAEILSKMGPKNILIKGGHLPENMDATDILYDGKTFSEFTTERIHTKNTHGTGCTYSAAIAAELAKVNDLNKSVVNAKKYLTAAIRSAVGQNIGHGHGPLNHMI